MGKIKGWRINRKTKNLMVWETTFSSQGVGEYARVSSVGDGTWNVFIYGGNSMGFPHAGGVEVNTIFPTKKEALEYAYNYMRRNPNG
jgi:hypothetical protein